MSRKPMEETTGYLLSQICKLSHARMHAIFEEVGLYRGQPFILHFLWENEGLTHSELAERIHVQPATITNALKRMEKSGFVQRRPDSEDQRVSRVYLTEKGRSVRGVVEKIWQEVEDQTFSSLNGEERVQFHGYLMRIYEDFVSRSEKPCCAGKHNRTRRGT
jgi:DNA-binding MarR family transcriptional regulator